MSLKTLEGKGRNQPSLEKSLRRNGGFDDRCKTDK